MDSVLKDARIRRRPAEKQALHDSQARCFCISDGNLGFAEMAQRYLSNWPAILAACAAPGPFLYSVRVREIALLDVWEQIPFGEAKVPHSAVPQVATKVVCAGSALV